MNADVDISKRSELFWGRHSENDLHWKNAFDSSQPLKQIAYGIVEIKKVDDLACTRPNSVKMLDRKGPKL